MAGEAFYFSRDTYSGLGLSLRVGNAAGITYAGPGVFYVSRPLKGIAVRYGATFPLAGGVTSIVPEVAFGFQF